MQKVPVNKLIDDRNSLDDIHWKWLCGLVRLVWLAAVQ